MCLCVFPLFTCVTNQIFEFHHAHYVHIQKDFFFHEILHAATEYEYVSYLFC